MWETIDWRAVLIAPVRFGGRGGESHSYPYKHETDKKNVYMNLIGMLIFWEKNPVCVLNMLSI
jgi:hypothetical protein